MKLKLLFIMSFFCVFYNTMNAQSGDPSVFGDNVWNVYVYNSTDTSFPIGNYAGFYTEPILSFDTQARWNQDSSPSTASGYTGIAVGSDNHSYAAKRIGFTTGYYTIDISSHDDSAYLYVNGVEVWNHFGCCDSHSDVWHGVLDANSTIEYRVLEEGGGGSHGSIKIAPVTINAVVVPFSSFSCQTTVTVTASGGQSPYTGTGVFTVGPGEYEYTVEDSSGGTSSTTVVVKDDSKPIVNTQNIIVNLGADGQVIITPEMVDDDSTDNCGITGRSLDRTTFSCADIDATSVAEPVSFTNMGTVSQNTHSVGGGYNPNTNEFWYPEWSGSTIYKYDTSHNAIGTLNAPVSQIMQLWMDKSSSDYYTANWNYRTINRINSAGSIVWTYNMDGYAASVTTSDLYVFAMTDYSNTIAVLDKTTGAYVKDIVLPGYFRTYGGLVYANGIIYISGIDSGGISTVPNTWSAIHAFDASTGTYISSVATNQSAYSAAFDGETIWVSPWSNAIEGYKVSEGNAYENDGVGNKVVLTVTDAAGNTTTGIARVTIKDITAPVITSNDDKNVDADSGICGATVVVTATATDNCTVGTPMGVRSDALALDAVYPVGTTTIKWNVADANSNDAVEVTQTIVVTDNQLPVIVSNGDQNVIADTNTCGATVVVFATATDNCTVGTPMGVRSDALALDAVYPVGTTTIKWNVADANSNDAVEVTQTVVVTDNQLPVIVSNGDKNATTDLDVCGATVVVSATATDNCTVGLPTGVRSDGLALDALYPVGTTTIAWNVLDANSNAAVEVIQMVVVADNQLPVIVSNGDKNVNTDLDTCGAAVVVSATATDNCTVGLPTGVRSDGLALDALYPVGTTTIAWNVLDANSNAAVEVIQTVVVADNQLPVIVSNGDKNVNTDVDTCGAIVVVSATATDNCTVGLPTGVRSDGLALDTLYPVGTTTIAWNVADANNNNAVAVTQTIVVTEIQKPVALTKNITVQLNAAGNATIVADDVNNGSTDACGIATLALDKTSFSCANVGVNTVILTVTDNNGNVATQTAIVTVEDKVAPVVITKNKTIQLNAAGTASIVVADVNNSSTDNCGISLVELDKMAFTCANVGANTVTLKVTDTNGNVATQTAIITVEDKIAPVVFTKNITVQLDASSNILIAAADVNNGSTDNCGISLLELDKALFSCADVGENVVTLKVTDNSGNVSTRTAIVTIVNSQPNLIRKHFDDVIFFDNSSKAFVAYSWYKNGVLVPGQTAQYFKDSGVLNGTYYAKATKTDGTVVTTCPLTFSASIVDEYLKIAPNPVRSNASYQILTNVDSAKLQNARITVFNILGVLVNDKMVDGITTDMIAPSTEGIYVVRMTLANGKYFTKNLLVKN